ncbi:tetratricopeptide repeat protein [Streptomyces sp. NPDC059582]|uniref:tetratricopeptide repeat protein n=1 Tax=Streptomyces sp. NPDC059582 TaxID=3346875 RepID=UPI003696CA97
MGDERRALVVASHWDAREETARQRLDLLGPCAVELRDLLLDPRRGSCAPACGDGLLDGPRAPGDVAAALAEAFAGASAAGASLLIGFVGHGYAAREGEFLFPVTSTPAVPDPGTALAVPEVLRELLLRHGGIRELTVVIDACMAGYGALAAAREWFPYAMQTGRNIDVLASSDGRPAYGLQFSLALNKVMRQGHVRLLDKLHTVPLRRLIGPALVRQDPQSVSYDGGRSDSGDVYGPWLAKNVARDASLSVLAASEDNQQLLGRLRLFQAPGGLDELAASVGRHRFVAVVGAMGTGKTTLAAALCRPELLPREGDAAPVRALVRLTDRSTNGRGVMRKVARQLALYLPGFADAAQTYGARLTREDKAKPSAEIDVAGPLGLVEAPGPVRVVIDGLDQLDTVGRLDVSAALGILDDLAPAWFGVVVTTREGVPLPRGWHRAQVAAKAQESLLSGYLEERGHTALQGRILAQAAGNWEIVRLLADYGPLEGDRPVRYDEVYENVLERARSFVPGGDGAWIDSVVVVLAASGLGAGLPRALLAEAAGRLGGPGGEAELDQALEQLPGLLERAEHATAGELLGVHHQTLVEYVREELDLPSGHEALAGALATMAPMDQHAADDPLHAYAEEAEPFHLWHAAQAADGEEAAQVFYGRLLQSLDSRASAVAAVNRDRWAAWSGRLAEHPGAQTPAGLRARERAAYWTGKAGAYGASRDLYEQLLEVQRRVLPEDHPDLLQSRHRIAYATGELAEFHSAVALHRAVLADQLRLLGPQDRRTLATRHHIAYWTGRGGDMAEGLRLHRELLEDQRRALGERDRDVLESRHYIAYWYGRLGRPLEALAMHDELLRDRIAVFGQDDVQVVFSRMNICRFLGDAGRLRESLDRYRELLPDVERHRGPDHPNTLIVRLNIARLSWELGDAEASLALHDELIRDQRRINGTDHPTVLISRYNMAMLKAELGDTKTALAELDALYEERLAGYGTADHPEVITTRYGRAWVLGQEGAYAKAVELMRGVRDDRGRLLGERHPDTFAAASALGELLAQSGGGGERDEAEALLRGILAAGEEAGLGERHPQTMTTRARLADLLRRSGRMAQAEELLRALLPLQADVLGAEHPLTGRTRRALGDLRG